MIHAERAAFLDSPHTRRLAFDTLVWILKRPLWPAPRLGKRFLPLLLVAIPVPLMVLAILQKVEHFMIVVVVVVVVKVVSNVVVVVCCVVGFNAVRFDKRCG